MSEKSALIKEEAVMKQHNPTYWPGDDEQLVVKEMLHDKCSKYWEECSNFVQRRIYLKVKNVPYTSPEEICQETMYRVAKYLPSFQFRCSLKTWLYLIVQNCITDMYRKVSIEEQKVFFSVDQLNESDDEEESSDPLLENKSAEDTFIISEDLCKALDAMMKYVYTHSNSERNRLIVQMVIIEGLSYKEAADVVGCSPPVVGYVVRDVQRYVREICL